MMDERRPLIAGNWKMYKTVAEALATTQKLIEQIPVTVTVDVMIAPPYTALASVAGILVNSPVALGAQNLHWEKEGAFTGEISASMLVSAGCRYVIIGHSERRQFFQETDGNVNRKLVAALNAGLIPVVCVGESETQREAGQTFEVIEQQITVALQDLEASSLSPLVIAYEPVWAIGTGKTATPEQAQEVHARLRELIAQKKSKTLAKQTRILYGGSVKPDNIAELMRKPDVDGALVGGASLDAAMFARIVNYTL